MRIGVDYYPEHWDKELWAQDAQLMAQTGVSLVRLAEFAWCRLEPSDNRFDFTWLDEAIDCFASNGIDIVLGTPTNCPPRWLLEKHPQIIPVGRDGRPQATGIRGHRCLNNPLLRKYSERIVKKLAGHYKDNKNVIAWQIDNELEAHLCFCETCNNRHREWLRSKYGTIENLNEAYGTVVWSNEYSSFDRIEPPYGDYNKAWQNPAYMLDFTRRAAEDVTEFARFQADIIRSVIPDAQITTNTWFCEDTPDFYRLFDELDFVSYDNYPTTSLPQNPDDIYTHAVHLDFMRGIKKKNYWIMEQLSGSMGCWMPMQKTTRPGMLMGYSLQAFAHGANTVVHFRWRTATKGAEMHWHGLIDHSNVPGRRFFEFAELCKKAKSLEKFSGTELNSDVAILYSVDSRNAFALQPQTDGFDYMEQIKLMHQAFAGYGVNIDIIDEHSDFSTYKIICAPALYVTNSDTAARLHAFAGQGGTVILTARSGVKDMNNNCIMAQLPTVYSDLTGCHVAEYDPIGWDTVNVRFNHGETLIGRQWCDILEADDAEVIARYASDFYSGAPAITRREIKKTENHSLSYVYYIGTVGERKLYEKCARMALEDAGISFIPDLPRGVELTTRTGNGLSAHFVFNNTAEEKCFLLFGENVRLKPFEFKVMQINPSFV